MKIGSMRHKTIALIGLLAAACTSAVQAAPYVMYRDAGCGCCMAWAAHAREHLDHEVEVREDVPMTSVKSQLGVPAALASCHTTVIEGYVIEGHVPARAGQQRGKMHGVDRRKKEGPHEPERPQARQHDMSEGGDTGQGHQQAHRPRPGGDRGGNQQQSGTMRQDLICQQAFHHANPPSLRALSQDREKRSGAPLPTGRHDSGTAPVRERRNRARVPGRRVRPAKRARRRA